MMPLNLAPDTLAHDWYVALGPAQLTRDAVQSQAALAKLAHQILALAATPPLAREEARGVGASLVGLCQDRQRALVITQALLAQRLSDATPPEQRLIHQPYLADLLSELGRGFLEGHAREVQKISRSLLRKVGHDLFGPLNTVIGFSRMLQKGLSGPLTELQQADLTAIHQAGLELHQRIEELLLVAKAETGTADLKPKPFEVPPLLDELAATILPLLDENENQWLLQCPDELPRLHADRTRVAQLLSALLDNAARFTVRGQVTLALFERQDSFGPWLCFEVSDTGIGIPAVRLRRLTPPVMAPFHEAQRGSLWLCHRLAAMMGGQLHASSVVGQGSTFTLHLPLNPSLNEPPAL